MSEEKKQSVKKVNDEREVSFVPFGCTDKVRLTAAMVRQFIAVPTASGALPSERDCIRFIMLCRGKRANPFEGDVFMIGYDAKNGPQFSMVCGLELFLKRAEQSDNYDGCQSGIIVTNPENASIERQGCLTMPGERLLGGWAKAFRKDRTVAFYKTAMLEVYNTNRSRWLKDPAGMIEKVAKSQALREAFPTALGGLYTADEMQRVIESGEGIASTGHEPIQQPRAITDIEMPRKGDPQQQSEAPQDDAPQAQGQEEPTPQQQLEAECERHSVSFDDLRDFIGPKNKNLDSEAESRTQFSEIPTAVCLTLAKTPKLFKELVTKFGLKPA